MYVLFEREEQEARNQEEEHARVRELEEKIQEEKKRERKKLEDVLELLDFSLTSDEDGYVITGEYGEYVIRDGALSSSVFNSSDAKPEAYIEMMLVAKAIDKDGTVSISGEETPEQKSMMAYAAELTGVKINNLSELTDFVLSDKVKEEMKAASRDLFNVAEDIEQKFTDQPKRDISLKIGMNQ